MILLLCRFNGKCGSSISVLRCVSAFLGSTVGVTKNHSLSHPVAGWLDPFHTSPEATGNGAWQYVTNRYVYNIGQKILHDISKQPLEGIRIYYTILILILIVILILILILILIRYYTILDYTILYYTILYYTIHIYIYIALHDFKVDGHGNRVRVVSKCYFQDLESRGCFELYYFIRTQVVNIYCCLPSGYLTVCHGKSQFKICKPSISMGHLYPGYVSHNQRVILVWCQRISLQQWNQVTGKRLRLHRFWGHIRPSSSCKLDIAMGIPTSHAAYLVDRAVLQFRADLHRFRIAGGTARCRFGWTNLGAVASGAKGICYITNRINQKHSETLWLHVKVVQPFNDQTCWFPVTCPAQWHPTTFHDMRDVSAATLDMEHRCS